MSLPFQIHIFQPSTGPPLSAWGGEWAKIKIVDIKIESNQIPPFSIASPTRWHGKTKAGGGLAGGKNSVENQDGNAGKSWMWGSHRQIVKRGGLGRFGKGDARVSGSIPRLWLKFWV